MAFNRHPNKHLYVHLVYTELLRMRGLSTKKLKKSNGQFACWKVGMSTKTNFFLVEMQ